MATRPRTRPNACGGMLGGAAVGLGTGGLMIGAQIAQSAINAGAAVGGAAIGADLIRDLSNNPMALAAIAGVLALVLLK